MSENDKGSTPTPEPVDEPRPEGAEEATPAPAEAEAKAEPTEADAPEPKTEEAAAQETKPDEAEPKAADTEGPAAEAAEGPTGEEAAGAADEAKAQAPPEEESAAAEVEAKAEEAAAEEEPPPAAEEEAKAEDGEAAEEAVEEEEPVEMPTDPVSLRLLEALEKGTPVQGKVFGWNQGGYHVLIDGLLAFCPRSEIDLGNPKAPKKYVEKTYRFHVIEHRPKGNRFTLSRTKILEEERALQKERTREKLEVGAVFQGPVTSITNFGAFVDLGGGVEGMVHVSELSHKQVGHPKEVVKKGQQVKVKVIKIEEDGKRISLSTKALEPDPWRELAEKYPRGAAFTGKVTGKTDFGVFVEVESGLEGLVHVSALPPGGSLEDEAYEEGKELSGWVKDVEVKRRRISLSLREVPTSDPWKGVEGRYSEGDMVTGTVEEIAPFGVFIHLEPGLTGLLPNSEMSLPRGTHPGRVYPPGSEVKVQVGRVEAKRKRITLLPEGAKVEGSRTDYREFKKKTEEKLGSGMPTLAAAFEKLKDRSGDESSS